ncbi:hypothetical protein TNCV_1674091 [Trichonephila clavipes]|nr:hypothetical protein TNCV_1674091 [Trichonephila clavipes]
MSSGIFSLCGMEPMIHLETTPIGDKHVEGELKRAQWRSESADCDKTARGTVSESRFRSAVRLVCIDFFKVRNFSNNKSSESDREIVRGTQKERKKKEIIITVTSTQLQRHLSTHRPNLPSNDAIKNKNVLK